jgi:hypothetical protein
MYKKYEEFKKLRSFLKVTTKYAITKIKRSKQDGPGKMVEYFEIKKPGLFGMVIAAVIYERYADETDILVLIVRESYADKMELETLKTLINKDFKLDSGGRYASKREFDNL